MLYVLLGLIAIQDILTGVFGAPSTVATALASHALGTRQAILLSTVSQFVGPFLFGVAVATAVGSEVVSLTAMTAPALCAALASTVIWMIVAWYWRIPSSSTHALIGGLLGAALAVGGPMAIHLNGLFKILISLTLTAPLGIAGGFVVNRLCYALASTAHPSINLIFNRGQIIASVFLGLTIGSNNAQNAMGVAVLSLVATGKLRSFAVPAWVVIASATLLALGNLAGGMRVMRSVSVGFFRIRPIHGLSAELSSAAIIATSSLLGGDVSTTHVTNMSIIGAGAGERLAMVRWGFVQRVLLTWIITIPVTGLLAAILYILLRTLQIQ
ncbi:MAG: inorganic phosphate transporter [Anaerolineae bacterium]|jgi:PiT family inorganic phosphate transporter|nr:inorganic phosphate transporter [Anaerolineae bacterium]